VPQFRLVHLTYLVSLLAVSLATFGARGLIPGSVLSVFWSLVYTSPARAKAFSAVPLTAGPFDDIGSVHRLLRRRRSLGGLARFRGKETVGIP
jgi:hypothetical protein